MKALMGTLRNEVVVNVTCWELKFHLFKALVLPTFTYGIESWGGDLKNSHWKVFDKATKMHMLISRRLFLLMSGILSISLGRN